MMVIDCSAGSAAHIQLSAGVVTRRSDVNLSWPGYSIVDIYLGTVVTASSKSLNFA